VNVYIESNFLLELVLAQEQHLSCEKLLRFCERGHSQLILPAFSLVEPHETLIRRHRDRRQLRTALDRELAQLFRTATFSQRLRGFQDVTALLVESANEEAARLEEYKRRILKSGEVIPLDGTIIKHASGFQVKYDFSPQDAVVYASVRSHLLVNPGSDSCFLNKNSKDFDNPNLIDELAKHGCKLLPRFDAGWEFVQSQVKRRSTKK